MDEIDIYIEEEAEVVITVDENTAYVIEVPGVSAASILTNKGDLLSYSTLPERHPVGTDGYILTCDSTESRGIKWAAPAANNIIEEGNSSIEVADTGINLITVTTDGNDIMTIKTLHQPITINHAQTFLDNQQPLMLMETTGTSTTNKGAILWLYTTRTTATNDIKLFKVYGTSANYFAVDNAGGIQVNDGNRVNEFSTDTTLAGNSDLALPTEKAVKTYVDGKVTKLSYITVTQAVNLDTMESDIAVNNAKVSNATHTGEVTGSTALTIADNVIDEANLKLDTAPTNGYFLMADSTQSGGMKWATVSGASAASDKIYEGDTSVETVDAGTGYVSTTIDSTEYIRNSAAKVIDILNVGSSYPNGIWFGGEHVFYQDVTNTTRSTVVGYTSGGWLSYGSFNSYQTLCFGQGTGQALTTGGSNCLIGVLAGAKITTGNQNCFLGTRAGFYENPSNSVAIGYYTGYYFEGDYNINIGAYAGFGSTSTVGNGNINIGYEAGKVLTTAVGNILIGHQCGNTLGSVSNKLYIENSNDVTNPLIYGEFGTSSTNKLCVNTATATTTANGLTVQGEVAPGTDDTYDLGNASYRWDDVYATNATIQTSDGRLKEQITPSDLGLDFINSLTPVSYKWRDNEKTIITSEVIDKEEISEWFFDLEKEGGLEGLKNKIEPDEKYEIVGNTARVYRTVVNSETITSEEKVLKTYSRKHYGMIAQDVEQAILGIGKTTKDFAGIIYNKEADIYGLRYEEFVAPLIKSVQELSAENYKLKDTVADLQTQLRLMLDRIEALEAK